MINKLTPMILLIGGAILAVPALSTYVVELAGGSPIIHIAIGIVSVLLGLNSLVNTEAAASA